MKRIHLLPSAVLAFLLTNAFLSQPKPQHTDPATIHGGTAAAIEVADIWNSPTGRQWLQGQSGHWRALLLNQ